MDKVGQKIPGRKLHVPGRKDCASSLHEGPRNLPATNEFFFAKASQPDGLSPVCKVCHVKASTANKDRAEVLKGKLGSKALMVLSGKGSNQVPHFTELLEHLCTQGGGIKRIVRRFWKDVLEATPGSPHRLKAQSHLFSMIQANTEMGHADKPVELMTDDELVALLDEKLPQLADSLTRAKQLMEDEVEEEEETA